MRRWERFYQNRTLDGARDRENRADDNKAETGALQPVHNGCTQLGDIYASYNSDRLALQAGRYEVNLPYSNKHDIRVTPQTYQAARHAGRSASAAPLQLGGSG